jgi:hypothetical protein
MNDSIKSALDLLDSTLTDKEFLRSVKSTKLLSDCKKKGFPDAIKSGLIEFPKKSAQPRVYKQLKGEDREKALKTVLEINKLRTDGYKIQEACAKFGINYQRYYDWAKVLGIEHKREGLRTLQTGHTLEEAEALIHRINKLRDQGKTILHGCKVEKIAVATYHNWTYKFKIKYTKPETKK